MGICVQRVTCVRCLFVVMLNAKDQQLNAMISKG